MKPTFSLLLAASLLTASAMAADKGPHEDAIKARQSQMTLYSYKLGTLGAMAKGNVPYDAGTAQAAANALLALTTISSADMWPQGSDMETLGKDVTRAKAAMWADGSKAREAGMALGKAAAELAEVAGLGLDEMRAAMGPVGDGCKGCHTDYRAKKN